MLPNQKSEDEEVKEPQDEGEDEKPEAKTVEELTAELASLQESLSRVNKESAGRRHKIKELEAQLEAQSSDEKSTEAEKLKKELDEATTKMATLQRENRTHNLRNAVRRRAEALKLAFHSEPALEDAITHLSGKIPEDEEFDDTVLTDHLKTLNKERPYLFKAAVQRTETDSTARGGGDFEVTKDEEADVAARFGIKTQ